MFLTCRVCRRPVPDDSPWVMPDGSITCSEACGRREYDRQWTALNGAVYHIDGDVHLTHPG